MEQLALKARLSIAMKVIIVEPDKQVVRRVIRTLHSIDSSIEVLQAVRTIDALLKRNEESPLPDLVLVNRSLLGATHRNIEPKLIITSSQNHLVYLAFRVNNLDYLQKYLLKAEPAGNHGLPLPRLAASAGNYPGEETAGPIPLQQATKKRFLVTYQQKLLSIPVEEIAYFFSDNRFIFFKTFDNRKFLVEYRMDELEQILDRQLFFRINRSYIISINSILVIHAYPGNRFKINLNPPADKEMIVSRERILNFRKWLGE
ncbi:MAG TPA: LytTR family transcriptional regulator DNA-binding domain-containing protein [Ferruginibacter sp.]|nr:LytTR family transcriptional regulator DNA-binding domain-containing protein [Ferruginibacter sp.]